MSGDRRITVVVSLVAVSAAVAAPLVLPRFAVSLLSLTFIAGLLAASVNLLAGQAGLVSIGHAGIAAIASYGVAWASANQFGVLPQLVIAGALVVVASVVYGVTTMHTNGIVFLMITLALGMVIFGLAYQLSTVTGGQNGLTGIRRPEVVATPARFYWLTLLALVSVLTVLRVIRRSPFGLMLRGIRDSQSRMSSLGYSVPAGKILGMVFSGLVAGLAGVLGVWQSEFISPAAASFGRSAMAVVMVVLGGTGTLFGPVVGAAMVVITEHWISSYVTRWPTLLGIVFILTVLFMPEGVVGAASKKLRRRHAGPASTSNVVSAAPHQPGAGSPAVRDERNEVHDKPQEHAIRRRKR